MLRGGISPDRLMGVYILSRILLKPYDVISKITTIITGSVVLAPVECVFPSGHDFSYVVSLQ